MSNQPQKDDLVVGFGEVLWDMLPGGKQLGGAPSNFAYHTDQCGLESCVISAIGDDALGQEIVDSLDGKKLNYVLEKVEYPTGTVQVTVEKGIPSYEIREGVAWDNIPSTDTLKEIASRTRAVCFGTLGQRSAISRQCLHDFVEAMPHDGERLIICDANLRQNFYSKEILEESMQLCNVLKINDEELITLSRIFGYPGIDLKDKCWILLGKYNLKMLILTCGINGSYIFTPGQVSFLPTPTVDVVDTVGAGDAFSASLISSILRGCDIKNAHNNAINVSAYVCTKSGGMPDYDNEVKSKLVFPEEGKESIENNFPRMAPKDNAKSGNAKPSKSMSV